MTGDIRYTTDSAGVVAPTSAEDVLEVANLIMPSEWRVDVATKQLVAVSSPTPNPILALRRERNRLLAASDWTRLDDVDLTPQEREEARIYRAALRDAPTVGVLPTPPPWLFSVRV